MEILDDVQCHQKRQQLARKMIKMRGGIGKFFKQLNPILQAHMRRGFYKAFEHYVVMNGDTTVTKGDLPEGWDHVLECWCGRPLIECEDYNQGCACVVMESADPVRFNGYDSVRELLSNLEI
jgi:hypothetical protein